MTSDPPPPPPRGIGEIVVSSRPYEEYLAMFGLTEAEVLAGPVLDCPGGAGGFAAGARARGGSVVSADPVYARPPEAVVTESRAGLARGLAYLERNRDAYVWTWFRDIDDLTARRGAGLDAFAADFRGADARYVPASLPDLPFADGAFGLALSGYLLFTYPDHLDLDRHRAALTELARVAGEVRVYPLIDTTYVRYPHLDVLRRELEAGGRPTEVRRVAYEFQRGADEVLIVGPRA